MTVDEAVTALRAAGLIVVEGSGEEHPSLILYGGDYDQPDGPIANDEIRVYRGAYHIAWENGSYLGCIAGEKAPDPMVLEEPGDLAHVVTWIIERKSKR